MSKVRRNGANGGMIVWDKFNQVYYVAKGGNDANSGRNIEDPVLTITQGLALAAAQTPTNNNRFAVVCLDGGIYTENIVIRSYVDIYAPNATLAGTITGNGTGTLSSTRFREQQVATGTIGINLDNAGTLVFDIDNVICSGTAAWVYVGVSVITSTWPRFKWKRLDLQTGIGFNFNSTHPASSMLDGGTITIDGDGVGIRVRNSAPVKGSLDSIVGTNSTLGIGIQSNAAASLSSLSVGNIDTIGQAIYSQAGIISAYVALITNCQTNYQVSANAALNLSVLDVVGGAETIAAAATFKKIEIDSEYASTADFALRSPLASTNSPGLSFLGDNATTEVEGSIQLITGVDPYLQISVDDDGTTPALTAVMNIYDDAILMDTDNAVDIGATGATRPKNYWGAGTVSGAGLLDTTRTQHGVSIYGVGGALAEAGPLTNGQLVIGSTGVAPVAAAITAGAGINVTNGAGSITIALSAPLFTWVDATAAAYGITVEYGYIINRGAGVTLTLPGTAALGDTVKVIGKLGLWTVAQNANQSIGLGSTTSTVGVGGSLAATNVGDCIEMVCITAGASTVWRVASVIGTIIVT